MFGLTGLINSTIRRLSIMRDSSFCEDGEKEIQKVDGPKMTDSPKKFDSSPKKVDSPHKEVSFVSAKDEDEEEEAKEVKKNKEEVVTPKKSVFKYIPAEKKPKPAAVHPPASEMVIAAITALDNKKGSSLASIKKYIAANYDCEIEKQAVFIKKFLKSAVEKNTLERTKGVGAAGSFRLVIEKKKPVAKKPAGEKKVAAKKTASEKKKPAAKRQASENKVAVKKTASEKKVAAKKPAAEKKVAAKKTAAEKKAVAKKPAVERKAAAKKPTTTKSKVPKSPVKKTRKAPTAKPRAPRTRRA